ncbi:MAG: SRPBCC family protein [Acidimicrobiia bacterium]|nr:SRPBCC family protein [Acidimicrobiia bacterium]
MTRIRVSIDLPLDPDQVWSRIENINRHVDWMADAESITITSSTTQGVGTTFDCVTKVGPIRLTDEMTITEWVPAQVMGVRHDGVVSGRGRFVLTPTATGTSFVWDETLHFPWWLGGPIGERIGAPILKAIWRRNLRRLRALVDR